MAFLEKVFKNKSGDVDIEEFLNSLDVEEETMPDADVYVKPISLQHDSDGQAVVDEIKQGNIVLLNIGDLSKRNAVKLREMVSVIKGEVETIDGDIARISADRVLVTPARFKIIKRRGE
ncbi:MAG: cell division protein SepF [archaeon]